MFIKSLKVKSILQSFFLKSASMSSVWKAQELRQDDPIS